MGVDTGPRGRRRSIDPIRSRYQQAVEFGEAALSLIRSVSAKGSSEKSLQLQEASTLDSTGMAYYRLGQNEKALDYYAQALHISETLDDKENSENQEVLLLG